MSSRASASNKRLALRCRDYKVEARASLSTATMGMLARASPINHVAASVCGGEACVHLLLTKCSKIWEEISDFSKYIYNIFFDSLNLTKNRGVFVYNKSLGASQCHYSIN
ncbi:hypothetical protein ACOSQ4_020000 [Xanthoceras sorbifolium]